MTDRAEIVRIPIAHSVHYVARGLPEVPNQYGLGVLAPSEITLTYRAAPDSQLGRVHAYVAGHIWVDGKELPLLSGGLYGQHYDGDPDSWPGWLAEEARLHEPAAVSAVVPAADRAALRDRIAEELREHGMVHLGDQVPADEYDCCADAVLSVLPAPADRAAVLAEVADRYQGFLDNADTSADPRYWTGIRDMVLGLRHIAAEAADTTPAETEADALTPRCDHCKQPDHSFEDCPHADVEPGPTVPAQTGNDTNTRVIRCADAAWTDRPHPPHNWQQRPDATPVRCPGFTKEA